MLEKYPEEEAAAIDMILEDIFYKKARELVLNKRVRSDSRGMEDIRPITCETDILQEYTVQVYLQEAKHRLWLR